MRHTGPRTGTYRAGNDFSSAALLLSSVQLSHSQVVVLNFELPLKETNKKNCIEVSPSVLFFPRRLCVLHRVSSRLLGSVVPSFPAHAGRRKPPKALGGGISKVIFLQTLSIFGDQCPQNGSKNEQERAWDTPTKGLLWTGHTLAQPRMPDLAEDTCPPSGYASHTKVKNIEFTVLSEFTRLSQFASPDV